MALAYRYNSRQFENLQDEVATASQQGAAYVLSSGRDGRPPSNGEEAMSKDRIMIKVAMSSLVAAVWAGSAAMAQPGDPRTQADTNGDGIVTRDEVVADASARFALTDADGDGGITEEEWLAAAEARRAEMKERAEDGKGREGRRGRGRRGGGGRGFDMMLSRIDSNADGMINEEEMVGAATSRFDKVDANGDGQISADEQEAARNQFRSSRQGRRGAPSE